MHAVTLSDFLTQGVLGPIAIGLTPSNILSLLGPPDDTSALRKTEIWRYGSAQLSFDKQAGIERLILIGVYFRDEDLALPGSLAVHGWWPEVGTQYQEFYDRVVALGVPVTVDPQLSFETQRALKCGCGVGAVFATDDDGSKLDSLQLSSRH